MTPQFAAVCQMFPQESQRDTARSPMMTQAQTRIMRLRFARTVLRTTRAMAVSAF